MRVFAWLAVCTLIGPTLATFTHEYRSPRRAFELLVHRSLLNYPIVECTWVSARPAQLHKALRGAPYHHETRYLDKHGRYTERRSLKSEAVVEARRYWFALDKEDAMWEELEMLCGEGGEWRANMILPESGLLSTTGIVRDQSQAFLGGMNSPKTRFTIPPIRVEPLIVSGPSSNRVDLTFFADGYTATEYDKFIADAKRLASDISGNQTFDTVGPLLNFWAAFTPSAESGIGTGGKPKDTSYGLYRDGTELRGVYYAKPNEARAACWSLGDQCDYPILVGNDDLYGGLGGEFTVITPSLFNGPLVLRHELGHSIIDIGEEYDGGDYEGYFGINAALSPSELAWEHWLTHPKQEEKKEQRVERSTMPFQDYAWTLLNTSSAWSSTFSSDGSYTRHLVRFSLSGLPEKKDLSVQLDGKDLGWVPQESIGRDRWHYDIHISGKLAKGNHEVKFKLKNKEREGEAQLCSVEVLEFGDKTEFNVTKGFYGVFSTYSDDYQVAFRPTNEGCLMRVVTTPDFCSVCKEGLWLHLLERISLIDGIGTTCTADGRRRLSLDFVPLGQFRPTLELTEMKELGVKENYSIKWMKDGQERGEWKDQAIVEVDGEDGIGNWRVEVKFESSEVRKDEERNTEAWSGWVVESGC